LIIVEFLLIKSLVVSVISVRVGKVVAGEKQELEVQVFCREIGGVHRGFCVESIGGVSDKLVVGVVR
jgi:hypothetical protein